MLKNYYRLMLPMIPLLLASLACNLGLSGVATPAPTIPVSTEAAGSLEDTLQNAYEEAQKSGDLDLVLNEEQLTSMVALELQKQGEQSIRDPQVYLRSGQIQLHGTAEYQNIGLPAQIILTASVDSQGRADFTVVSASVGPFPVPDNLITSLEANLDQGFNEQMEILAPNTRIDNITVEDGYMRIAGRVR
jgi:hypothetical protein